MDVGKGSTVKKMGLIESRRRIREGNGHKYNQNTLYMCMKLSIHFKNLK